jgi:outer membrane protein TolC
MTAVGPTDPFHNESVQLGLTWTLFDSGTRYADRKTRVAVAESQALDERMLRRQVGTMLAQAVVALKAARQAYKVSEDAVAAGRKNTQETELLYQQGLAKAIELVDANERRFEAEVGLVTAKLAMEQAYLDLRYAQGLSPVTDAADPLIGAGAR